MHPLNQQFPVSSRSGSNGCEPHHSATWSGSPARKTRPSPGEEPPGGGHRGQGYHLERRSISAASRDINSFHLACDLASLTTFLTSCRVAAGVEPSCMTIEQGRTGNR